MTGPGAYEPTPEALLRPRAAQRIVHRSMLDQALLRLDDAARHLQLDDDVLEKLKYPHETTKTRLMIRMDDGSRKSFLAWRCRYDDTRGPTKGGIRFHPQSTMDEVETLAFWMTFKCAVLNLPYGGGKGAVRVDTHELSKAELERLSRAYVQAFARILGPDRDIAAPDLYTNSMVMGWMADEFATIVGQSTPAVVTGKPIALAGSLGREDATARGGYYLLRRLAEELGLEAGQRVAIQGFGNAGQHVARLLHGDGYKIVAVSDTRGAIYCSSGLPVDQLISAKEEGRFVTNVAPAFGEVISPEDLIGIDCDLLVPAAIEDLIHVQNVERVRARVILELANGPITPEADEILQDRGVTVLPDILANAGGVTVSYFEWVQNRQGYHWTEEEVHSRLKTSMEREGSAIWDLAADKGIPLRTASYVHALARLAASIEAHGTQHFFTS